MWKCSLPLANVPLELKPREGPGNLSAIHRSDIKCFPKWLDDFQMTGRAHGRREPGPSCPGGQSGEMKHTGLGWIFQVATKFVET